MEREKGPYSLVRRCAVNPKRYIYYVKFRDETGNYLTPVSSFSTSKKRAADWADKQIRENKHLERRRRGPTFAEAAADIWDYEKSGYIRLRLARKKSFSRALASDRAGYVRNHLLPAFGEKGISAITHADIDAAFAGMQEAGKLSQERSIRFS